jgi:hypothetical protein
VYLILGISSIRSPPPWSEVELAPRRTEQVTWAASAFCREMGWSPARDVSTVAPASAQHAPLPCTGVLRLSACASGLFRRHGDSTGALSQNGVALPSFRRRFRPKSDAEMRQVAHSPPAACVVALFWRAVPSVLVQRRARNTPPFVMPGLDPGIHPQGRRWPPHGLPGQARQWQRIKRMRTCIRQVG